VLGRRPFRELVERQLDLVGDDEADLLAEISAAEARWNAVGRDEAEEAYGDFQLAVDALADRLLDVREAYAVTVDEAQADAYRKTFNDLAARRFRRYPTIAADLS
jgi:hypothetical protein